MTADRAIDVSALQKRYGPVRALDGLDLTVRAGTVTALLGPNGAGKTTALRILTTLTRPDGGRATVAGFDVEREPEQVRLRIGSTGQFVTVDDVLSGRDNLVLFGRLFHLTAAAARRRADELLEQFALADAGDRSVRHYSGGMRRRLDLAAALVRRPEVLFLDEPTTGLDPRSRNDVWDAVRGLVAEGTTVLLTTQHLDEADQLAHDIAVIQGGRLVAQGSPERLKASVGGDRVEVVVRRADDLGRASEIVARHCSAELSVDAATRRISAPTIEPVDALLDVVRALHDAHIAVDDIGVRRPTLDEAFLRITDRRTTEEVER